MAEKQEPASGMTRPPTRGYRRRRRTLLLAVVLLCLAGAAGVVPDAHRMLAGPVKPLADIFGRPVPPVYAYDLPREGDTPFERPVSVAFARGQVYVSDSLAGHVAVFRPSGVPVGTIGGDRLGIPLYVAIDEVRGELLVTDRGHEAVLVFDAEDGSFVETITPSVDGEPEAEPWAPLAIDVADDGSLYVTDVAGEHKVWHLTRDGERLGILPRSAEETPAAPGRSFDYPNAVKSLSGRVWVADSNNRRLVEFSAAGEQVRSLPLGRLIRGFDVVMAEEGGSVYFALVDVFSHQVVIVSEAGSEIARIGEPGDGPGQLSFPNDVVVAEGIAWIADTGNLRVQAWEWDGAARSAAFAVWPGGPTLLGIVSALVLLLSPLALLLNLRPASVVVSGQTLPALRDAASDTRVWKRVRLLGAPSAEIVPSAYLWLPPVSEVPISRADADIVRQTYELDVDQAETLTLALRARSLLTDDPTLARIGRARGIDVYDIGSFIEEFSTLWEGPADEDDGDGPPVFDGV